MKYPATKREEVVEVLHGKTITDQYRWLENFDAPEVQEWLEEQHEYLDATLSQIPNYQKSTKRILDLLSMGVLTAPRYKKGLLFYQKSTIENQPILFVQKGFDGEPKVLLDPNLLAKENPVGLDWYSISPNAKYIVYGLSEKGDEWSLLHIKNIDSGEILAERIPRTRFCSLAWESDESGFYYTRYPIPGTVPKGQENYNKHVFHHKLGANWEDDPKIFGEGREPTNHYFLTLSKDNRYLIIGINKYSKNDLYMIDFKTDNKLIEIVANEDNLFNAIVREDELWIITNKLNPRWAVYKTKLENPTYENWELVIPASEDIISQVLITKDKIFTNVMRNASDHIKCYSIDGKELSEFKLPKYCTLFTMGSGAKISAQDIDEFYFGLRSFLHPTTIYRYEIESDNLIIFDEIKSPVNPEDYEVKQVWYPSKDGVKVSMFIAHKKGIPLNGNNPTLLGGYGGFNLPIKPPYYRNSRFFWLENNGVLVIANLRGGSEYGEDWHKDGMLEKKQNVFDDFIYAGIWLIDNKYASNKTLSIFGRSNGGLLTGAAITQRPDLFGAVYIGVPLLDMLRYHHFKIARYWIPEYGSAENPEQFEFIKKYSPYQNVKPGTKFPPTILVAAASDSRVDANHAMKMTALLQSVNKSDEPIVLFVERKAGHGVGKPLTQLAKTETDLYTFLGWKTGLKM